MGIGFWQIVLILLVVLVLFGRGRVSGLAEEFGKSVRMFKKGLDGEDGKKDDDKKE